MATMAMVVLPLSLRPTRESESEQGTDGENWNRTIFFEGGFCLRARPMLDRRCPPPQRWACAVAFGNLKQVQIAVLVGAP